MVAKNLQRLVEIYPETSQGTVYKKRRPKGYDVSDYIVPLGTVFPMLQQPSKSVADNLILLLRLAFEPFFCRYVRERQSGYSVAPRRKFTTRVPRG